MSPRQRMMVYLLGLSAMAGGCSHFQGASHPLYPGPVRPAAQTATLDGYVGKVDDVDVSNMPGPFALLPGCHVVTSRNSIGDDSPSGAWSVVMPRLVFAFRMQAGHAYEIRTQRQGSGSETANLRMRALELDGGGKKLGEIPPVHGKADLQACRTWDTGQPSVEQPSGAEGE